MAKVFRLGDDGRLVEAEAPQGLKKRNVKIVPTGKAKRSTAKKASKKPAKKGSRIRLGRKSTADTIRDRGNQIDRIVNR